MVKRDASIETVAHDLAAKLRRIRQADGQAPIETLRTAYEQAVADCVGSLTDEQAAEVTAQVKAAFVDEARGREKRILELETENDRMAERILQLEAERDRVLAENKTLREAPGSVSVTPSGSFVGGSDLDKIRTGMMMIAEGQEITAHIVGLSESDARFLQLCRELLRFALDNEMGVNILKAEFSIGPASGMDTQMLRGLKAEIRERFRACLDNKDGSLDALKESLANNAKFIVLLNSAYGSALGKGSRALLAEISPATLLEKHKRMLGYDHEKSWQELERLHGDLSQLSRSELWERFYYDPFRERLDAEKI